MFADQTQTCFLIQPEHQLHSLAITKGLHEDRHNRGEPWGGSFDRLQGKKILKVDCEEKDKGGKKKRNSDFGLSGLRAYISNI